MRRTLKPEASNASMQGRELKDQQKVPIALKFKLVLAGNGTRRESPSGRACANRSSRSVGRTRQNNLPGTLSTEYRLPIQAFEAFERRMKKLSLDSPDAVAAALESTSTRCKVWASRQSEGH
ncbi:MAG: hypothetical protein U5N86_01745 [Planctomycetota bacterium]|nr:hypothetical protein [Planctomycetota bacterium]